MLQNSFGVHLSYASVSRQDGADPRDEARGVLRELRVPAGLRDATAAWTLGSEALLSIPVTDEGRILTLTESDTIATTVTVADLRDAFAAVALRVWLDVDDDTDASDDPDASDDTDASDETDASNAADASDETERAGASGELEIDSEATVFAPDPVRVAAFSHRGPVVARYLAEFNGATVTHIESGDWSLQRYSTSEPAGPWAASKAELPLIELNRVEGGGDWIDVTARSGSGMTIPFWTDAERDTQPVLELDAITVPETAEIYRRLLTEGDGSRDELLEVAAFVRVDVDAAHLALIPEALGGVKGTKQRQGAFMAAFGIPAELIDAGLGSGTALETRTFAPTGWRRAVRETVVAGMTEWAPLTRRNTPLQRFTRWLATRPLVGVALSSGVLAVGAWGAGRFRGVWRAIGVLAVIDAIGDLIVWCVRIRRGR